MGQNSHEAHTGSHGTHTGTHEASVRLTWGSHGTHTGSHGRVREGNRLGCDPGVPLM